MFISANLKARQFEMQLGKSQKAGVKRVQTELEPVIASWQQTKLNLEKKFIVKNYSQSCVGFWQIPPTFLVDKCRVANHSAVANNILLQVYYFTKPPRMRHVLRVASKLN